MKICAACLLRQVGNIDRGFPSPLKYEWIHPDGQCEMKTPCHPWASIQCKNRAVAQINCFISTISPMAPQTRQILKRVADVLWNIRTTWSAEHGRFLAEEAWEEFGFTDSEYIRANRK